VYHYSYILAAIKPAYRQSVLVSWA